MTASSTHTSAFDRIRAMVDAAKGKSPHATPDWMCELTLREGSASTQLNSASLRRASDKGLLPVEFKDYLKLLDWSGRQVRSGKRGVIPSDLAPILDRLGINTDMWTELVTKFDQLFGRIVGRAATVAQHAAKSGWQAALSRAKQLRGRLRLICESRITEPTVQSISQVHSTP